MSSSSSPPEPPVLPLIDGALAEVGDRYPESLARAARWLGVDRPELRVGAAELVIEARQGTLQRSASAGGRATLRLSDTTLLALLEGERDLVAACRAGDVELRGDVRALARFFEAFRVFLHGCVRVPENEARRGRYRAAGRGGGRHDG